MGIDKKLAIQIPLSISVIFTPDPVSKTDKHPELTVTQNKSRKLQLEPSVLTNGCLV